MTTNTIKHRMLKDAKKIANKKYVDTEEMEMRNGLVIKIHINALMNKTRDIDKILEEHPEYNEDVFLEMIRVYEKENKDVDKFDV